MKDRLDPQNVAETPERALPAEEAHAGIGARFTSALGHRLPELYGGVAPEYELLRERAGVVDLSYQGIVSVTGPDAKALLDRILSSEVSTLSPGHGQPSTLLTHKGKVVGVFDLFEKYDNDYVLRFAEPLAPDFVATFEKYAFLSDVQVIDDSDERCAFLVQGPLAAKVVVSALGGGELPAAGYERVELDWDGEEVAVSTGPEDATTPRFILEAMADSAVPLFCALCEAAVEYGGGPVGFRAHEIVRVEEGRPRFGVDFTAENFPNEAGYERALTFGKCYVGQEVVARMKTYGHANRTLRGVELDLGPELESEAGSDDSIANLDGATLLGDDDGTEVGRITSSVRSPRCGMIALSLVHRQSWEPGTRLTVQSGDRRLHATVRSLPFEPDSEQS